MALTENETGNVSTARQYLDALGRLEGPEVIAQFLHPDVVQQEFPNRLTPQGARRDREAMIRGVERGRQLLTAQRFEFHNVLTVGDQVALEVTWTGTLAVALGTMPPGAEMRARFATFLEFRDGRIVAQRNYDCFEPW
jgi:ketosteroid isomerase-like protein